MTTPVEISPAGPSARAVGRAPARAFAALSYPSFRWFWAGALVFQLAMNMSMVGTGWLVYRLTDSPIALGSTWTISGIALVSLPVFGGVIADRFSKRWIITLTQTAILLSMLAVLVLLTTGRLQFWHMFFVALIGGCSFALNLPARQAIIPELVAPPHLMNGIALNAAAFNVTRVLGPAIGGGLVGWFDLEGLYWAVVLCYLVGVVTIVTLPHRLDGRTTSPRVGTDLRAGWTYLRRQPVLIGLVGMAVTATTFGMFYQLLMPVFAKDILRVGAEGLGLLLGTVGAGAVLGSLLVAWLGEGERSGQYFVGAGILYGLCLVGFAASGLFPLALLFLFIAGLANGAFNALNNTLLMAHTEPAMRGRVMGFYFTATGFLPLMAIGVGALAGAIGAPWTVGLGGALVAALIGAQALAQPAVRKLT